MRADDLSSLELLTADPETGLPISGPVRTMIVGLPPLAGLVEDLTRALGPDQLKRLFTRFGYNIGLQQAAFLSEIYEFDSAEEWLKAGSLLRRVGGMALETITDIEIDAEKKVMRFSGMWEKSFEATMYLANFGETEAPICFILCGIVSGYASAVLGSEVLVKESACEAAGAPFCSFEGRSYAAWGLAEDEARDLFSVRPIKQELEKARRDLRAAAEDLERKQQEISQLREITEPRDKEGIIYRSESMAKALEMAKKVSPTDSTVLIQGESGTGKELMARFIHNHSGRHDHPFLAINCAALPPTLLESELFGHKKGSFTGADQDKKGLFVEAGRGTLFLDEVGELPLELQAKLLRAIQEREVRPVGDVKDVPFHARIIAASNSELRQLVRENRFREDLYYRLSVFPLHVAPLRVRRQDILLLARHFLNHQSPNHPGFTPEAIRRLERYTWPGNVRELENWVEYAVVLAGNERIRPEHLPQDPMGGEQDPLECLAEDLPPYDELERRYIRLVLDRTQGNKSEAARVLGMSMSTLWRRLKETGTNGDGDGSN